MSNDICALCSCRTDCCRCGQVKALRAELEQAQVDKQELQQELDTFREQYDLHVQISSNRCKELEAQVGVLRNVLVKLTSNPDKEDLVLLTYLADDALTSTPADCLCQIEVRVLREAAIKVVENYQAYLRSGKIAGLDEASKMLVRMAEERER